jgi:hypothetical protein
MAQRIYHPSSTLCLRPPGPAPVPIASVPLTP